MSVFSDPEFSSKNVVYLFLLIDALQILDDFQHEEHYFAYLSENVSIQA